jgi:peptidyl-dipeptidase Dcp
MEAGSDERMAEVVEAVEELQAAEFGPENPFYQPSELPFGAPPFDRIRDEHYEPALLAGMEAQRREVKAIAENPAAPTFENTIVALERTGALLERTQAAFWAMAGANTNPAIEKIQQDLAPKFAAHWDAISLDAKLFQRVEEVYGQRAELGLDGESARLLELGYKGLVHAGAQLNDADKAMLMALNAEESTLSNDFNRKLLAANNAGAYVTSDAAALDGLSETQLVVAADAAQTRGVEGYALALKNTTQQPVLAQLTVRATRQAIFEHSLQRTEKGDENDTRAVIARMAQLRAEKARLLGFASYAAWKLDDQMARTPQAAIEFMDGLVEPAKARAAEELKDIQAAIDAVGGGFAAAPWDWDFYAEQVRKAKYDLNEQEIRPYFEANRVLVDGVFYAATRLYGIAFAERHDLPVWAPDVRVYEIFNADRSHLALFYVDLWKRDNKRGGAWMSSFVRQSKLLGRTPVIYNVSNFAPPAEGQPGLISFDDVTTMFHEFGHALHGMFSEATYPGLAGTGVPRDFVELPSQFNEHWAMEPEVFANYAMHFETGAPMPEELATKIKRATNFNRGYERAEVLAAAALDMQWHTLDAGAPLVEPDAFERAALERKGLALAAIPPRYRSSYFAHIWGGGYSAGYYAYLWSEVLDDRAWQWFKDHGGMTRANGDRFRTMVLARGNTEDLNSMFERWLNGSGGSAGSKA